MFCDRKPELSPIASFGVTITDNGTSKPSYRWRRVLLKVSGEALAGDQAQNIDPKVRIGKLLTCLHVSVLSVLLSRFLIFHKAFMLLYRSQWPSQGRWQLSLVLELR